MQNKTRQRRYGFRLRMSTRKGRNTINRRRACGRHNISI